MDEEIYTVEDIFERDTPLTEDLFDNSDGLTLSPITMLRRYMAEKELKKQKEDAEETAEETETDLIESMGYMNGGGIGSMMQPKQNFLNGGRVGLFMGGSPLDGEALAIYNSMNAYGYDDQTIADKLSGLNLYTPPGTTPPDATPPPPPGGNSGGDGGGDGGAGPAIITKKTRDKNIDLGIAAANADKGNLTLEEITAMNDLSGQESMRGQITPKTTLEKIISSNRPTMADIANEKTTDPYAYSRGPQTVNASEDINESKSIFERIYDTTAKAPNLISGLPEHLRDNDKIKELGLTPENYNVISAMNAADNMNAGVSSLIGPASLYTLGDTISNSNQSISEGFSDLGRYMKGANIQNNPELAKKLMGEGYVNQMQGKYALAMDKIGKGIFGKGPNPSKYANETDISSLPSSAALAAALGSTNASSALDQLISSNEITDRNRGMEDNENFIDRGDPNNDLRVASEEMGLVGGIPDRNRGQISPSTIQEVASALDRPNMADIANIISKDNSISVEDFSKPFSDQVGITGQKVSYPGNQTGMIDGPPSIGFAKDPEGVEDPFGGKYTPSFEKQNLTGLAGLIDSLKGYNFKDALSPKSIGTGAIGSKIVSKFGIPGTIGSFGANQFRKKLETNRTEKAIAASKNRKETRALQAKIDAAEKKRKDDITKRDNTPAAKQRASEGRAYDYSGRSNKQGTHTSTVSKQKAADNRESRRGQTSSNKGSSNKGSSNKGSSSKGSTSSGAGGGGGASRGRGRDRDDRMARGGRVAKAIR